MSHSTTNYNPENLRNIDSLWVIYLKNSLSSQGISWQNFLKLNLKKINLNKSTSQLLDQLPEAKWYFYV